MEAIDSMRHVEQLYGTNIHLALDLVSNKTYNVLHTNKCSMHTHTNITNSNTALFFHPYTTTN